MLTNELILKRLDTLSEQIAQLGQRQHARDELIEEMTPIAREALATAIARLDALEQQGYFAFAAEVANVGKTVVERLSPDDVRRLGDSFVAVVDALRDAGHAKSLGPIGAVRTIRRDADVQRGLGVFIDVLRRLGRAATPAVEGDARAKLAALIAPRRGRKLPPAKPKLLPGPKCATPAPVDADVSTWSRDVAQRLAAEQSISLTEEHWALIEVARADFAATHASPNIQRLTQVGGVATKELYRLFPKAPARTIAKLAGLPKPAGCL